MWRLSWLVPPIYTDTEQECKKNNLFVYGITRSKQFCVRKPDKNEYKAFNISLFFVWVVKINILLLL